MKNLTTGGEHYSKRHLTATLQRLMKPKMEKRKYKENVNAEEGIITDIMKCLSFKYKIFSGETVLFKCIFNEFHFFIFFAASLVAYFIQPLKDVDCIKGFPENATTR